MFSYFPSCDNPDNIIRFKLKNYYEVSSSNSSAMKLIAIFECFVSSNFKIREKTLDSFFKTYSMSIKLVFFKIILEVFWTKAIPIYHEILYFI